MRNPVYIGRPAYNKYKEKGHKIARDELNDMLLLLEEEMSHIVTNLKELRNLRNELEHWEQKFSTGTLKIKKEMLKRIIWRAELRKNDLALELKVDVDNMEEIKEVSAIYRMRLYSR